MSAHANNPAALAHAHRVESLNSLDRNALKIVATYGAVQPFGCPICESERSTDAGDKAINQIW